MRYQAEHKGEIHQKIVKEASQRVRAKGLTGVAVSAVMHGTGLTHGGFYKHFGSKDELIRESLGAAFRQMADCLARTAEQSEHGTEWKAIVNAYLSPQHCDHAARGCPLAALAPELARANKTMKAEILEQLIEYKNRMLPFMPGRRAADKERAFFAIFSTMIGAIEIARILPEPAMREKVLASARDFILQSF